MLGISLFQGNLIVSNIRADKDTDCSALRHSNILDSFFTWMDRNLFLGFVFVGIKVFFPC